MLNTQKYYIRYIHKRSSFLHVSYMYEFIILYLNGIHFVDTGITTKVYFIFKFVGIYIILVMSKGF